MRLVYLFILPLLILPAFGQGIWLGGDFGDEYADYLINSGRLMPDYVLQQPWDDSVSDSLSGPAGKWFERRQGYYFAPDRVQLALHGLERVRGEKVVQHRYRLQGSVGYQSEHIALFNRTVVDQDYKYDANFAGDLSESESWIYGRVQDAFIRLEFGKFSAFFGRTARNWGAPADFGLILSDNPYSYDHLLLAYTTDWFRMSLIFARLEDVNAFSYNNDPEPTLVAIPNARKYLVGHRLDLRILDNLQVGFSEMATYGGAERDIDLTYFNPMNFYYGLQRNDRRLMSGMWAVDLFWKPADHLTLYGQFLLDDIIVNNEPGVDDRARYPDRLGVNFSLRSGDLLLNGLNTRIGYTRIWNRTYQSRFTYENYHYRGLGLGYPRPSSEEFKFSAQYWGRFPWYISQELLSGRYGSVDFADYFPLEHEPFPVPPVTNVLSSFTKIGYYPSDWLSGYVSFRYFSNPAHYLNRVDAMEKWRLEFGVEFLVGGGIGGL